MSVRRDFKSKNQRGDPLIEIKTKNSGIVAYPATKKIILLQNFMHATKTFYGCDHWFEFSAVAKTSLFLKLVQSFKGTKKFP